MKNLDLNAMGVVEMDAREVSVINGGFGPGYDISGKTYNQDQAILDGMATAAGYVVGFIVGIFV